MLLSRRPAVREPQRRRSRVRPGRLPLRRHRRRRLGRRSREPRAEHAEPPREDAAPRRAAPGLGAGDRRPRAPQPVALLVRPLDRRPLHRRRRAGRRRGGRLHAARRAPGSRTTAGTSTRARGATRRRHPGPGKLVFPVFEYGHDRGCTVVGGFVYRGKARPAERGRYIVGDYCSGIVWSFRVAGGKSGRPAGRAVRDLRRPHARSARTPPASSTRRRSRRRSLFRLTSGSSSLLAPRRAAAPVRARRTRARSATPVSSRSSRATSVKPSWCSVVRFSRSSSSAIRSSRSRSASSWRSPTSCCSTRAILRGELRRSVAGADDDRRLAPSASRSRSSAPAPVSSAETRRARRRAGRARRARAARARR